MQDRAHEQLHRELVGGNPGGRPETSGKGSARVGGARLDACAGTSALRGRDVAGIAPEVDEMRFDLGVGPQAIQLAPRAIAFCICPSAS